MENQENPECPVCKISKITGDIFCALFHVSYGLGPFLSFGGKEPCETCKKDLAKFKEIFERKDD